MSTQKGSTALHQKLVKDFQLEVPKHFSDLIVITYTVGMFRDFELAERIIRAGVAGVPDLIVFGPSLYVFFDAKTGNAVFSKEQKNWKRVMKEINGAERVFKLTSVAQGIEILKGIYAKK